MAQTQPSCCWTTSTPSRNRQSTASSASSRTGPTKVTPSASSVGAERAGRADRIAWARWPGSSPQTRRRAPRPVNHAVLEHDRARRRDRRGSRRGSSARAAGAAPQRRARPAPRGRSAGFMRDVAQLHAVEARAQRRWPSSKTPLERHAGTLEVEAQGPVDRRRRHAARRSASAGASGANACAGGAASRSEVSSRISTSGCSGSESSGLRPALSAWPRVNAAASVCTTLPARRERRVDHDHHARGTGRTSASPRALRDRRGRAGARWRERCRAVRSRARRARARGRRPPRPAAGGAGAGPPGGSAPKRSVVPRRPACRRPRAPAAPARSGLGAAGERMRRRRGPVRRRT